MEMGLCKKFFLRPPSSLLTQILSGFSLIFPFLFLSEETDYQRDMPNSGVIGDKPAVSPAHASTSAEGSSGKLDIVPKEANPVQESRKIVNDKLKIVRK